MCHPSKHAADRPDKLAAVFVPSQQVVSYGLLEEQANRTTRALRATGVSAGDSVVFCIGNRPEFLYLAWGCQRVGAIFTPISTKIGAETIQYIVRDSAARVIVLDVNAEHAHAVDPDELAGVQLYAIGGDLPGFERWEDVATRFPSTPIADPARGREMMYSSGTTGRPKGVRKAIANAAFDAPDSRNAGVERHTGAGPEMSFLCTSPLYHAAPHRWVSATLSLGGTAIIMEHFDPLHALRTIDERHVTHSIWVPTMFQRLLRLDPETRTKFDLSTHRVAVHGAAPCPVHVKQAMIDWWGPILSEYYAGTEGIGACAIESSEWLKHKGSVGRAVDGVVHILDEEENELDCGQIGGVYFEISAEFSYWKDDAKTSASRSRQGWWTYGDIGYLDAERYLYLTDRKDFTIISGGVNIYPREIEEHLSLDDRVLDVAVFGIPDDEYGESVQAIVQISLDTRDLDLLEQELKAACRECLGSVKTPRSIAFVTEFPRLPTGKLQKKMLRDEYLRSLSNRGIFPGAGSKL